MILKGAGKGRRCTRGTHASNVAVATENATKLCGRDGCRRTQRMPLTNAGWLPRSGMTLMTSFHSSLITPVIPSAILTALFLHLRDWTHKGASARRCTERRTLTRHPQRILSPGARPPPTSTSPLRQPASKSVCRTSDLVSSNHPTCQDHL